MVQVNCDLASADMLVVKAEHDHSGSGSTSGIRSVCDVMTLDSNILNSGTWSKSKVFHSRFSHLCIKTSITLDIYIFIAEVNCYLKVIDSCIPIKPFDLFTSVKGEGILARSNGGT